MILLKRVARLLVVSSLGASLSLMGVIPQSLTPLATAAEPPSPSTKCCCGTAEARCRGQACCGAVPSEEAPKPCSHGQSRPCLPDPLLAMQTGGAFAMLHRGRRLPACPVRGAGPSNAPTLQADQVRLQI